MTDDRRRAFRRNAFTFGTLHLEGREIECLVWDTSTSGALIEVEDASEMPERFSLSLERDAPPRAVTVAWRRGRRLGVTFAGAAS